MIFLLAALGLVPIGHPVPASVSTQDSVRSAAQPDGEPTTLEALQLTVGELLARMPSDPWREVHGGRELRVVPTELQRRVESGKLTDEDWRLLLLDGGVIHTRSSWLAGMPFVVWIRFTTWLHSADITIRSIHPEIGSVSARDMSSPYCGNCLASRRWRERNLTLGELPPDTTGVEVEVTIEQRVEPGSRSREVRTLWNGRVRIPVRTVASIDEILPSISDSQIDASIRRSVRASWWDLPDSGGLGVCFGGSHEEFPELREVAVSVQVEVRRSGVTIARADGVASSASNGWSDYDNGLDGCCVVESLPDWMVLEGANVEDWEVVLTGQSKDVLPVWEARRWWNGRISIPLADLLNAGRR